MAGKIALDLKQFKHVKSDKNSTTLQHKDGHQLTLAHKALSPEFQAQLQSLGASAKNAQTPLEQDQMKHKMADGGTAGSQVKYDRPGNSTDANDATDKAKATAAWARGEAPSTPTPGSKAIDAVSNAISNVNPFKAHGGAIGPIKKQVVSHSNKHNMAISKPKFAEGDKVAPASLTGEQQPDIGGVADITGQQPGAIPPPTHDEELRSKVNDILSKGTEGVNAAHALLFGNKSNIEAPQIPSQDNAEAPAMSQPPPQRSPASVEQPDSDVDQEFNTSEKVGQEAAQPQPQPQAPVSSISHEDKPLRPDGTFGDNNSQAQASAVAPTFEDHKQAVHNELQSEDQAWQQDLNNGHISPKTYSQLFANKGTLSKIGTIFGLLLSGAGGGLSGQPNAVLAMMNNEIANDLESQKQSKQNAQNFLRLTEDNLLKKSQASSLDAETAQKAYALTRMHMNYAALHQMADQVKALPMGSPERQQAEATLAMLNSSVQNENYNIADRAASASAYYKMVLGNQGETENPAIQVRKKALVGAITPQQSEAALGEIKKVQDHVQINKNALDSFDKVSKMVTPGYKVSNPIQHKRQIEAEWSPMMDKLTKDTEGRVTPITIDLMSSLKPETFDNPQTLQIKRQKLNAILNAGFATPTLDSVGIPIHKGESQSTQTQQATPQYKTDAQGVRWMRGPNGEAIRVN